MVSREDNEGMPQHHKPAGGAFSEREVEEEIGQESSFASGRGGSRYRAIN